MVRSLLADRFGLKLHREPRQLPVYALAIDEGGPKIKPAGDPSAEPKVFFRKGEVEAHNRDMAWLTAILERQLRRTVLDRTGLTGSYDFDLQFGPRPLAAPSADDSSDPPGPSLNTALQTQLGLTLKAAKDAVEILVIDEAKKPGAN